MYRILVQTLVLASFPSALLARVRFIYGPLALDAIDPHRADFVDAEGVEWTDLGGGPHAYTAEHVARLGWLAANREAMRDYVLALDPDQQMPLLPPALTQVDVQRLRSGVESVLAPQVVRQPGEDETPFEQREDLAAVFAEQGEQDVMLCVPGLPTGFEPVAEPEGA